MLDRLLGRASLRERIAELEDDLAECERELERTASRYEREDERRREAVTARQDAERRANRLEDRIAQLEGELERATDRGGARLEPRVRTTLRGTRLERVLDRLEAYRAPPDGALTTTVGSDVPSTVTERLSDRWTLVQDAAPCLCLLEDEGLLALTLDPPDAPTLEPEWDDRFRLDRAWFQPTGPFVLALARADLFAAGRYDGEERVEFEGFESRVKGKHSKGGYSQSRFERIREEQIAEHLEDCASAIESIRGEGDRLYLVGQREAVSTLAEEFDPAATATVDATGKPREALEDAFRDFWTTELRVL